MERFAMNVRGLSFTIPTALFLHLYLLFTFDKCIWQILLIAPLGYLMGYLYEIWFYINTSKFPNWLSTSTNVGEFLTGSIILGGGLYYLSLFASSFL